MSVKLFLTISDGRFRNFYTRFDSNYERLLLENGRYGHAPIQYDPIRVLLALVSQSLISLYQEGRENAAILRNGWHTPSEAHYADH